MTSLKHSQPTQVLDCFVLSLLLAIEREVLHVRLLKLRSSNPSNCPVVSNVVANPI